MHGKGEQRYRDHGDPADLHSLAALVDLLQKSVARFPQHIAGQGRGSPLFDLVATE